MAQKGKISVYIGVLKHVKEGQFPTHRLVARYIVDPRNRRLGLVTPNDAPAWHELSQDVMPTGSL